VLQSIFAQIGIFEIFAVFASFDVFATAAKIVVFGGRFVREKNVSRAAGSLQSFIVIDRMDQLLRNLDLAHDVDERVGIDVRPLRPDEEDHHVLEWHFQEIGLVDFQQGNRDTVYRVLVPFCENQVPHPQQDWEREHTIEQCQKPPCGIHGSLNPFNFKVLAQVWDQQAAKFLVYRVLSVQPWEPGKEKSSQTKPFFVHQCNKTPKRVLLAHVHEEERAEAAHALRVPDLGVEDGVRAEDVEQHSLSGAVALAK